MFPRIFSPGGGPARPPTPNGSPSQKLTQPPVPPWSPLPDQVLLEPHLPRLHPGRLWSVHVPHGRPRPRGTFRNRPVLFATENTGPYRHRGPPPGGRRANASPAVSTWPLLASWSYWGCFPSA